MTRLLATAVVTASILAAGSCAMRGRFATRMQSLYCAPFEDDMAGAEYDRRMRTLRAEGEGARRALLRIAVDEPDVELRACAYSLLTELREPRVLPVLRAAASEGGATSLVRVSAVANLGVWRDPSSIEIVRTALHDTDDADVTLVAVSALSRFNDARALSALREALASPRFRDYRANIIRGLRYQTDLAALDAVRMIAGEPVETQLTSTVHEAVLTLAALGTAADRELAVRLVERIRDPERRRPIADALRAELERQGQVPSIEQLVEDLGSSRAVAALQELRRRGPDAAPAIPAVVDLLRRDGWRTSESQAAFDMLPAAGPASAKAQPLLVRFMVDSESGDMHVQSCIEGIARMLGSDVVPHAITATAGEARRWWADPEINGWPENMFDVMATARTGFARAQSALGVDALPALRRALRDGDEFEQAEAAAWLGSLGAQGRAALPWLRDARSRSRSVWTSHQIDEAINRIEGRVRK